MNLLSGAWTTTWWRERPAARAGWGGTADPPLQIGPWTVNPAANELCRGEETAHLEPKAMEVLLLLAARAGEAVAREALLDAVWSGVVVGDEALTQSIIKLRKALGDNPRAPSYIETIPKRGYRLIAQVTRGVATPGAPPPGPAPRGKRVAGVGAGILLLLALGAGVWFLESRSKPPAVAAADSDFFDPAAEERAGIVSVAVLPFEAVGDGAQDFLARGIGSDLMTDLSRLSGLRVIDGGTGEAAGRTAPAARYVVTGSVQRDGETLRVNVRLVDSRSHEQLWSLRLERPYGNLLEIQNEISSGLVAQLPGRISDAERRQLAQRNTHSVSAYEHFLRAKALFLVRRPQQNEQARAEYVKAIAADPQFARAYAGLAMTHAMDYRYRHSGDAAAALARAEELAESARQIDPDNPEVYWALGFVRTQSRHYEQAVQALQQAIRLNPSYADAYALLGGIYTYTGEAARSIPSLRKALRLNPGGGYLYFLLLGRAYLFQNDPEQALINLREAARRNPEDLETHVYLAAALVASADRPAAELEADEVRIREPGFSTQVWLDTYPMTSVAYRNRLLQLTAVVLP